MSERTEAKKTGGTRVVKSERIPLGSTLIPVRFGDQVITSLLFNHDANPVHHKPEHAVQWMLGLFASNGAAVEGGLTSAGPEERTYTLGSLLLQRQDVVVMPGAIMGSLCFERFIKPEELTVSVTTTFTYPLLVPTKGEVEVKVEAWEIRIDSPQADQPGEPRHILIEAEGPSLQGPPVKLLKIEAVVYPAGTNPEVLYEKIVSREFERVGQLSKEGPELPSISHPAAISNEDRRRYATITGIDRPITPMAWQAKIPRVLTEIIDHFPVNDAYTARVKEYYTGRDDEAERRRAIDRYVDKEIKYRHTSAERKQARVDELAGLSQRLYARQHTVFDPRRFINDGPATIPAAPFHLDLHLYDVRLRRGVHRFYTGARIKDQPVFMGEALVSSQPLVTRELANFMCEINYSLETLRHFEYRNRREG